VATQRPGWRTGTALISSGRPVAARVSAVSLVDTSMHFGLG